MSTARVAKPGDWHCVVCNFDIWAPKTLCAKCGSRKPSDVEPINKEAAEATTIPSVLKKRTLEERVSDLELLVALLRKEHRETQEEAKRVKDYVYRCKGCNRAVKHCSCPGDD